MSDFTLPSFHNLVELTLVSLMLSLGLSVSFRQVISLWQKPGMLIRAILGMSVVVPFLAIAIGVGMDLPAEVKVGLALVSISPGTSLPLQYLVKPANRHLYAGALQTTTAFLSIMTVPLTLAIVNECLPANVHIAPLSVVKQLLVFQFLPLVIGIALHQYHAALMEQNAKFLVAGATPLLYALLIWSLGQEFNPLLHLGVHSIVAIALLALVSLWMGHWLGGKEMTTRTLLALTLTTHNVSLALFIAIANLPNVAVSPVIAVYGLFSAGLAIAYFKWHQHRPGPHKVNRIPESR